MSNQELIEYLTDNSGEYNKRINRKYLETHDLNILHILYNVYDDLSEKTPVYEIYYRLKNNLKKTPSMYYLWKTSKIYFWSLCKILQ